MIVIIVGTNKKNSTSRIIAEYYQKLLEQLQEENMILDLAELPADFTGSALYDKAGKNEGFNRFRQVIEKYEKFIFIVPEYNGSFPGVLKAFIDGLKYPESFRHKKCALVGHSAGVQGGGLALSHLTDIFNYLGMHVLALKPKLSRLQQHLKDGIITDPIYAKLIEDQVQQFLYF